MATSIKDEVETAVTKPSCLPWYKPFLKQINELQNQQRLPHAILMSLPGEADELEFIWHLSMFLLCRNSRSGQPCGECSSCHLMLVNTYPDFKLVGLQRDDKTNKINKNIKIEQIRKIIHEVYLTRSYDNLKIIAIYPADKMSHAGANSLLKTLEEPASQVLIILATHKPGKIPVTLRSRCQQWNPGLPAQAESMEWLQAQGLDQDLAHQHLELANNDPTLALKLKNIGYLEIVSGFKQQFARYLKNQIDVTSLTQTLTTNEISITRRLISMVIKAYCYQYSGYQGQQATISTINKTAAQAMIALLSQSERQLMTEENNRDIQLQLEDVLISLKQIINRSQY